MFVFLIDASGNPVTQVVISVTDASGNSVTGKILVWNLNSLHTDKWWPMGVNIVSITFSSIPRACTYIWYWVVLIFLICSMRVQI